MTRPRKKSRRKRESNPGSSTLGVDALTTRPMRRLADFSFTVSAMSGFVNDCDGLEWKFDSVNDEDEFDDDHHHHHHHHHHYCHHRYRHNLFLLFFFIVSFSFYSPSSCSS